MKSLGPALSACALVAECARIIPERLAVHSIDCDLCKCTDRFWPNCTGVCQTVRKASSTQVSLTAFEEVLVKIGAACQVYADVSFSHELSHKEWCVSTTPERSGFVIESPPIAMDGYSSVRTRLIDQYAEIRGSEFLCQNDDATDGYVAYPAAFAPSLRFCPMADMPQQFILQSAYSKNDQNKALISMIPHRKPMSAALEGYFEDPQDYYNADAYQPWTLRYMLNNRTQGQCYGTPTSVVLTRRLKGYYNGRNYQAFRASARNRQDLLKLTRMYHTKWTGPGIEQFTAGPLGEDFMLRAPGFNLMKW